MISRQQTRDQSMHYICQLKNLSKYSGICAIRILSFPTSDKVYGPKVFLLTKIKSEYSDILCSPTHLPGPLVCRIRQVPLYTHL